MKALKAGSLFLVVLVALAGMSAFAQGIETASITGTVTDPTGAVVPGAQVVLEDPARNLRRSGETNTAGVFTIPNIPPGTYRFSVTMQGFRQAVIPALTLGVARSHTVNVTLEIGTVAEVVEVVGGARVELKTTDATVGTVVGGSELQQLPTLDRSAASLLLLQPMVVGGGGSVGDYEGGAVAGSRSDQTTFFLDGGDATNDTEGSGGYAYRFFDGFPLATIPVPVESIEEFQVNTTNPTATYGRTGGAAINLVTKRGTNEIHGSAYWYHQNDNLDANSWTFNRTGVRKPEKKDNRYGFSVGGPVWKDRTFLYGHFEGRRFPRSDSVLRIVPRDSLRAGILRFPDATGVVRDYPLATIAVCGTTGNLDCDPRRLGIPAVMQSYFGLYPAGNDGSEGDRFNTIGFRAPADFGLTEDFLVVRFDQRITDKWNFFGSYRYNRRLAPDVAQLDIAGITGKGAKGEAVPVASSPVHPRYVVAGVDTQITPTLSSQFRFSWTRNWWEWQRSKPLPQVSGTSGAIDVGGDAQIGSLSEPMNIDTQQARSRVWAGKDWYYSENLAWVKGSHTFQFGGSFREWDIFHRRNDKVLGAVDSLIYFSRTDGSFLSIPAANRPPTCTAGQAGFCITAGDISQWDMMYANALGLMDRATILLTRDAVDLSPLPIGTPLTANVTVRAYEAYFQDTWRATPSLTFSYGLNYSVQVPGEEDDGKQMVMIYHESRQPVYALEYFEQVRRAASAGRIFNPEFSWVPLRHSGLKRTASIDWNNWGPRFAVAWNPSFTDGFAGRLFGDRRTVIRGGYSRTFDRINGVGLVMTPLLGVGLGEILQCGGPTRTGTCALGVTTPSDAFRIGWDGATIPLAAPTPGRIPFTVARGGESSSRLHDPGRDVSQNHSYNLTWQRELPWDMILEMGYVGKLGRQLIQNLDMNSTPLYYRDPASGQLFVQAFDAVAQHLRPVAQGGAGGTATNVPVQAWFENLLKPLATLRTQGSCTATDTSTTMCLARRFSTDFINGHVNSLANTRISVGNMWPHVLGWVNAQSTTNQLVSSTGKSWYSAGFLSVRKRMSHGLTFAVNYTYANSIDDWGINQQYVNAPPNSLHRSIGIGPSFFDRRHSMTAHGIFELPFGRGRRYSTGNWADKVIGGWSFGWVFNAMTGLPLCVTHGGNWGGAGGTFNTACGIGPRFTGSRHDGIKGSGGIGDIGTTNLNIFSDPEAVFKSFRRQLYSLEQRSGRGFIRGQNRWDLDFGITKRTAVTERVSISFHAAISNPTNNVQLNDPGTSLTSPRSFGVLSSTYSAPRVMNFGLRVDF